MLLTPEAEVTAVRIKLESNRSPMYRRGLRERVTGALEEGLQHVIIDCSSWADLDLLMLSAVVGCANACRERGAYFRIENLRTSLHSEIASLHLAERIGLSASLS